MSLPRHLSVDNDDLYQEPVEALKSLREAPNRFDSMTLPANQEVVLPPIEGGNTMEFEVEIDSGASPMVEMNVLRSPGREEFTRIAFYRGRGFRGKSLLSIDSSYASSASDVQSRASGDRPTGAGRGRNAEAPGVRGQERRGGLRQRPVSACRCGSTRTVRTAPAYPFAPRASTAGSSRCRRTE